MHKKLALKRLTRSDLTLFEWQFRHVNAGNQKAINLNADVLVELLFPAMPDEAKSRAGKFAVDLDIYGPGPAPRLNLQRKIIKLGEYKNWRLNGEFIFNPPESPDRFNTLREGDIALLEFTGQHFPDSMRIALVSQALDAKLHAAFDRHLGSRRMSEISPVDLDILLNHQGLLASFPIAGASLESSLEDAAVGGAKGMRELKRRSGLRRISKEELQQARQKAEEIGALGEEFVNDHLTRELGAGRIEAFTWASRDNAIMPFDFEIREKAANQLVDVKTTRGPFENPLHISIAELLEMRDSTDYRIFRVYGIVERQAKLRVSGPMKAFAEGVLKVLTNLPKGVEADAISVDPRTLTFAAETPLEVVVETE
ncbi:hypothetical protein AYO46_00120 [Betaproteobacteria bacterium SCGC AG-212-J23]|nr:hypothetical protein AYO46_00120 [Betaproteobacteria bacterium SCGC AG-212-J23]